MQKYIPRIGKRFGSYIVTSEEIVRGDSKKMRIHVKCDCGNEKILDADYLRKYNNPRCSSCSKKESMKKVADNRRKNHTMHRGIGSLNKTFISSIRNSALRRGYKWEVTIEELYDIFLKQNRKCALSGVDIWFCEDLKDGKYDFKNANASLDRINSSKDYTLDNVQWLHKDVNKMKNIFSQDYFKEMCKNVTERS